MEQNFSTRFTNELATPVPTAPLTVTCKSCGAEFVLPPDEQLWYGEKFDGTMPTHCRDCRKVRRKEAKHVRRARVTALRTAAQKGAA